MRKKDTKETDEHGSERRVSKIGKGTLQEGKSPSVTNGGNND